MAGKAKAGTRVGNRMSVVGPFAPSLKLFGNVKCSVILIRKEILDQLLSMRFIILSTIAALTIWLSLYDGYAYYRGSAKRPSIRPESH